MPLRSAFSDRIYGQAYARTRASAGAGALYECSHAGGKSCIVQTAPCAGDDPRFGSPLPLPPPPPGQAASVDPRTVGTWELSINPGVWVWKIAANGTYEFHSNADDNAPSHAGTFTAKDGKWSMHATSGYVGYTDGGTYDFQSTATMIATGHLGTGTWHRQ